jgi:hypothetical protein
MKCAVLFVLIGSICSQAAETTDTHARAILPLVEATIRNLDTERQQFQNQKLSMTELSLLSHREITRFEAEALGALAKVTGSANEGTTLYHKDAMIQDLKSYFADYRAGKLSLQNLIRKMIHEHTTVNEFVQDPELGYSSFIGFKSK